MRINNEMAMQNSRHNKRLKAATGNTATVNGSSEETIDFMTADARLEIRMNHFQAS